MRPNCLFAVIVLATPLCFCSVSHAQLSGAVDLGGGASSANGQAQLQSKQIAVTGLGANPEAAEKQAVTDAVRQAVGTYVDANTLVENEEVIQDRILSVSSGFVKEYKVVSPAKQREDGLYEVQILAGIETTRVVNALKQNNIISGEVAGSDMWAQTSTKVMNAQDAVAMLQAKMPEWIKSSVTVTPLGEDGKPLLGKDGKPSTAPASVKEDAVTGKATLRWYLELGLDKKYYKETILPPLQKCMEAITGVAANEVADTIYISTNNYIELFSGGQLERANNTPSWPTPASSLTYIYTDPYNCNLGKRDAEIPLLFKSFSRTFDSYEALTFPGSQQHSQRLVASSTIDRSSFNNAELSGWDAFYLAYLQLKLLDESGDVLALKKLPAWQPFAFYGREGLIAVGPSIVLVNGNPSIASPLIVLPKIEMEIDLLKEVKNIEIALEVPELQLSLSGGN